MRKIDLIYALHRTGLFRVIDGCRDVAQFVRCRNRDSYSQSGEDLYLKRHFGDRKGFYIDIGGNHPTRISNTYLLYRLGWRGIVVEPIRRMCAKHRRFRPRDVQVHSAAGATNGTLTLHEMVPGVLSTCDRDEAEAVIARGSARLLSEYTVPVTTVTELYDRYLAPHPVSLLSVDTEGFDLEVLRGTDWSRIRPEVIICEAISETSNSATTQYLMERGYVRAASVGCNSIFMRREASSADRGMPGERQARAA